ncbi:hypothetical protein GCM10028805_52350 [Spirosoma harenae]
MANHTFSPGDIVKLNSGGPDMTVAAHTTSLATCYWYSQMDHQIHTIHLPPDCLRQVKSDATTNQAAQPATFSEAEVAVVASAAKEAKKALSIRLADKIGEFLPLTQQAKDLGITFRVLTSEGWVDTPVFGVSINGTF